MISKFEERFGYILSDNNRLPHTATIKKYLIERMYADGISKIAIAEEFNLKRDTINKILKANKCTHYFRIAELISSENVEDFNKEYPYEKPEKVVIEKNAPRFSLYETITILRKEPKCRLWNKDFIKFNNKDWIKINKLYGI
jgi:IS30 family transposase